MSDLIGWGKCRVCGKDKIVNGDNRCLECYDTQPADAVLAAVERLQTYDIAMVQSALRDCAQDMHYDDDSSDAFALRDLADALPALLPNHLPRPVEEADVPLIIEAGEAGAKLNVAEASAWTAYEIGWRDGKKARRKHIADQEERLKAYLQDYEFRGDTDYKPNEQEQLLIEDALRGWIAEEETRPTPSGDGLVEALRPFAELEETIERLRAYQTKHGLVGDIEDFRAWCVRKAETEGDLEIGAGFSLDPPEARQALAHNTPVCREEGGEAATVQFAEQERDKLQAHHDDTIQNYEKQIDCLEAKVESLEAERDKLAEELERRPTFSEFEKVQRSETDYQKRWLDAETQLAGLVDALKKARVAIDMTGSRVADWAALHTEARAAINQALAPSQAADIIERQQAALQSAEQRATKLAEENGALERARAVGMERICDLEADRDKLAGEVERLKEVTVGPLSYTAMRARAEAAEAQLAGVVDALKRIASLKFANTPGLNVEPSPLDAFNTAQHIARQVLASILVMRAPE